MSINHNLKFLNRYGLLLISGLVSLCTGILYFSIASSRLTNANFGSDGGDFLAAILTRGIPHPTGYPTYVLLGILFQYIPFGTPVFRAVLESLIPAAIGAGLVTAWVGHNIRPKSTSGFIAAGLSGLAWGITPILFSQAVIVEVLGLQTLFVISVLWWITLNLEIPNRSNYRWVLFLSFLVGLGCGNHITLALIAPAALFALIYMLNHTGSWKSLFSQVGLILVGLLVYLYLPLRAHSFPPINWGNPQTWSGFIWEVTGVPYRGLLFSAQPALLSERIRSVASLILDQYGALGLIAGVIGAIQFSFSTKWLRWILVWTFVVYFIFAIGYGTKDSIGYLLPAVMVFAIWIGLSIPSLWSVNWKRIPVGVILTLLLIISIGVRIPGSRTRSDARLKDQPAQYADEFFLYAPLNAIVETRTDEDTFPLWYYHFGLKLRPDLRIVVLPLTQFVWYQETLVHTYPDLLFPGIYPEDRPDADWGQQIKELNPERPVCTTKPSSDNRTGIDTQCISP